MGKQGGIFDNHKIPAVPLHSYKLFVDVSVFRSIRIVLKKKKSLEANFDNVIEQIIESTIRKKQESSIIITIVVGQ